jgi:uncharacterized protein YjbI with pentapeptide repeats
VRTELTDSTLTGVRIHKSSIQGTKIEGTRIKAMGFDNLQIQNSVLKNVEIRADFDRFPRQAQNFSIQDTTLENVVFVSCTLRDTTIRGISASNLRIEGKNLSGMTIDSVETLQGLAKS